MIDLETYPSIDRGVNRKSWVAAGRIAAVRFAVRRFAFILLAFASVLCTPATAATGDTLSLASWNLGWHISTEELPVWIEACARRYARNQASGIWEPSSAPEAVVGWQVSERRAKLQGVDLGRMPPCGVYLDSRRQGVAVTAAAWAKRNTQLQQLFATRLNADIIAFQEVSGVAAVRQALGPLADQYNLCSFDGQYKVQRLAFAWKKALGTAVEACKPVHEMSLPQLPLDEQVRPGLTMALNVRGKLLRLLTVHLKSSCVSSLERGQLDSDDLTSPCSILQKQIAPFENAFEKLGAGGARFVVLGDFNRNLWHEERELSGSSPVRSDGSKNLTAPLAASVKTQNLWKEVNDGQPPESRAVLLALKCMGGELSERLCDDAKSQVLERKQLRELASAEQMGCRNPVGLDQVVVSENLAASVRSAVKLPIGKFGGTLSAKPPNFPDPVLAVSDHCPTVLTLGW